MSKLAQIQEEIQQLRPDIKAEAVVAQMLGSGVDWSQLVIHTDSLFYRNFNKDIFEVVLGDTGGAGAVTEMLHLHLCRAGLYDLLPEGLFFAPVSTGRTPKDATEMAEEYKFNQKREQEIRTFFAPLENEFFYHRYRNLAAETALLKGLNNDELNRYFINFWQLPAGIDPSMALRIVLLLPYVHRVAGDAELMAACLQTIIGEQVSCRTMCETAQHTRLNYNILGGFNLGRGLTCGMNYEEEDYCFVFTIENLSPRSQAQDFLEGGKYYPVLQTFSRFFVPVAANVRTDIKLHPAKENMHIGVGEEAVLGIATVL